MEYRELGRTGLRVSEIGLGCEGFVGKTEEETQALMTQAVEAGVNCMDLYTSDPECAAAWDARCGAGGNSSCCRRICVPSGRTASTERTRDIGEVRAGFEDMLRLPGDRLSRGRHDPLCGLPWTTWNAVANGPVMAYAHGAKSARGGSGCIGLSSHNPGGGAGGGGKRPH